MLVWDATCPDTLAPSHSALATREASAVAEDAEHKKKHLLPSYHFVSIAVETLGGIREGCSQLVQRDYTCEVHHRGQYGTPTFPTTYISGGAERQCSLSPWVCTGEGRGVRFGVGTGVWVDFGILVLYF